MGAYCLSGLVSGTTFSQYFWEVQELLRVSWVRFQDLVSFSNPSMKKRRLLCYVVCFFVYPCIFVGTNTSAEIFGLDTGRFVKSNKSLI